MRTQKKLQQTHKIDFEAKIICLLSQFYSLDLLKGTNLKNCNISLKDWKFQLMN